MNEKKIKEVWKKQKKKSREINHCINEYESIQWLIDWLICCHAIINYLSIVWIQNEILRTLFIMKCLVLTYCQENKEEIIKATISAALNKQSISPSNGTVVLKPILFWLWINLKSELRNQIRIFVERNTLMVEITTT